MNIRKIEHKDIEEIVDININAWRRAYRGIIDDDILDNLDRNKKIEKWRKSYNKGYVIVAEEQGKVLGYCRYSDSVNESKLEVDSEIMALYVDCNSQKQGIGKALMEEAMRNLKLLNKKNMILWCLEENINARKFYERMGGNLVQETQYFEIEGRKYKEVGYKYFL